MSRRNERDINTNGHMCSSAVPVISRRIVIKREFSRQILEKYSNIKFHENPSNGSRCVPWGRTDRPDEANSRFSQFFERTKTNASSYGQYIHLPLIFLYL